MGEIAKGIEHAEATCAGGPPKDPDRAPSPLLTKRCRDGMLPPGEKEENQQRHHAYEQDRSTDHYRAERPLWVRAEENIDDISHDDGEAGKGDDSQHGHQCAGAAWPRADFYSRFDTRGRPW